MQIGIALSNPATRAACLPPWLSGIGHGTSSLPGLPPAVPTVIRTGIAQNAISPDLEAEAQRLFGAQLLPIMPHLRAFGFSLSRNHDRTDDLVQETLLKALRYRTQFTPGSNLVGWLTTILRNEFFTLMRKRREVEDVDGMFSSRVSITESQIDSLELKETMSAIQSLSDGQRSAILLVAALGYTCQEAADRCRTEVGTIKSRVNRGRASLKLNLANFASPQRKHGTLVPLFR